MISKTKTFYLTEAKVKFILQYLPTFNLNDKLLCKGNVFIITLNTSEQEKLINGLDDLFVSIGLKEDDEPNEIGLQIEALIDIFNPYKK